MDRFSFLLGWVGGDAALRCSRGLHAYELCDVAQTADTFGRVLCPCGFLLEKLHAFLSRRAAALTHHVEGLASLLHLSLLQDCGQVYAHLHRALGKAPANSPIRVVLLRSVCQVSASSFVEALRLRSGLPSPGITALISAIVRIIVVFGALVALGRPCCCTRGTLVPRLGLRFDRVLVLLRLFEPKKSIHYYWLVIL